MFSRRRLSAGIRRALGCLAIAACLLGTGIGLKRLLDDGPDPHFICTYPGYKRLDVGMSASDMEHILGKPGSKRANTEARILAPTVTARLQAELKRVTAETWTIYKALYEAEPRPTGVVEYQLRQRLTRCQKQQEQAQRALSVLVKEVWDYNIPGWQGHIEVSIDVFGRVSATNCGCV